MARIAMAMSGGVDSSVAAALLKKQGHEVIGIHMKLFNSPIYENRNRSCCSFDESMDARSICYRLGIPFYVIDYQKEFREMVIDYFVKDYAMGQTPNPCVMCNKKIKNDLLLKKVDELDCDYLATGHYARIFHNKKEGSVQLARAKDLKKDQTYFLYGIKNIDIKRILFPLENKTKVNVRNLARKLNLITANKPDSQEICFVKKDYKTFLKQEFLEKPKPGEFVSQSGKVLGKHNGIPFYTIGQRRGIGLTSKTPFFVVRIDSENNRIVLGRENDLYSQNIHVSDVNWVSILPPDKPIRVNAKIRNMHEGSIATIFPNSKSQVRIEFEVPQRAVTPGQSAVFYQNNILLGGGRINNPS